MKIKKKIGLLIFVILLCINTVVLCAQNSNDFVENFSTDDMKLEEDGNGKITYKGFEVLGIIEIPTINLTYPVLSESTQNSLQTSVALIHGEGLNKVGNSVIIGHNYKNGKFFSDLDELVTGDKIYITDIENNKVIYEVYKIYETSTEDDSYYTRDTEEKKEISLSTTTDDAQGRTVVFAKETTTQQNEDKKQEDTDKSKSPNNNPTNTPTNNQSIDELLGQEKKTDPNDTLAKKVIPKTGTNSYGIIFLIIIAIACLIVYGKKCAMYHDLFKKNKK